MLSNQPHAVSPACIVERCLPSLPVKERILNPSEPIAFVVVFEGSFDSRNTQLLFHGHAKDGLLAVLIMDRSASVDALQYLQERQSLCLAQSLPNGDKYWIYAGVKLAELTSNESKVSVKSFAPIQLIDVP
jgi:hypothetical protein